ncbi:hypothetical protein EVAR_60406_1 [Eumeta japonica]|uniref:Uncharacterized protein n=1 Tax=Eumeta variegata TaxID=151549 RepID=A0A4C1YS85_EUMVA|nr:hypothetical protein EVAR_60406_1 [Eumeta japonica]
MTRPSRFWILKDGESSRIDRQKGRHKNKEVTSDFSTTTAILAPNILFNPSIDTDLVSEHITPAERQRHRGQVVLRRARIGAITESG